VAREPHRIALNDFLQVLALFVRHADVGQLFVLGNALHGQKAVPRQQHLQHGHEELVGQRHTVHHNARGVLVTGAFELRHNLVPEFGLRDAASLQQGGELLRARTGAEQGVELAPQELGRAEIVQKGRDGVRKGRKWLGEGPGIAAQVGLDSHDAHLRNRAEGLSEQGCRQSRPCLTQVLSLFFARDAIMGRRWQVCRAPSRATWTRGSRR